MLFQAHEWDMGAFLTKRIPPSRSAAADLCRGVLDWTRDGWWFRAWPGALWDGLGC